MIGIGDFDSKSRNTRKVITREGQKLYMGKKYAQDKKTGYYVCTTLDKSGNRRRLHDVLWEHENIDGIDKIPKGCVIHHIDWDKTHNEINNLTCVTVFGHNLIHNPPKERK